MLNDRKDTCDREAIRYAFLCTFVLTKVVKLPVWQPYKTDTLHSQNNRVYLWKRALLPHKGGCKKRHMQLNIRKEALQMQVNAIKSSCLDKQRYSASSFFHVFSS